MSVERPPPLWLVQMRHAAKTGNASANLDLGRLYLAGREVPRDLPKARGYFAQAASGGDRTAAAVVRAFAANGTGGVPDWPWAMQLLEDDKSNPDSAEQLALIAGMPIDDAGQVTIAAEREVLSVKPQISFFPNFVTAAEADYLIARATPQFQPALVLHPITGHQIPDPVRTSDVASFPLALEQPAIYGINRRIAAASGTEVDAGEPLTVLRYRPGQQYRPHLDTLPDGGNQRVATMLIYLNDGYGEGTTHFPRLNLDVKGRKGDALLFFNLCDDGKPDQLTLHEGRKVTSGQKLVVFPLD